MKQAINTIISFILILTFLLPVCPEPAFALSQLIRPGVVTEQLQQNVILPPARGAANDRMAIIDGSAISERYRSRRYKRWIHLVKAYQMVLSGEDKTVMIPFVDGRYLRIEKSGAVYLRSLMIPVPFSKGTLHDFAIRGPARIKRNAIDLGVIDASSLRCIVKKQAHNGVSVSFFDREGDGRRFIFSDYSGVAAETIADDEEMRYAARVTNASFSEDNGALKKSRTKQTSSKGQNEAKTKTRSKKVKTIVYREPGVTYTPIGHESFMRFCDDMMRGGTRNADGTISVLDVKAQLKGRMITIDPRRIREGLCVTITQGQAKRFKIVWYDTKKVKIGAAVMDDQALRSA
jgi:hypothetical protein